MVHVAVVIQHKTYYFASIQLVQTNQKWNRISVPLYEIKWIPLVMLAHSAQGERRYNYNLNRIGHRI